MARSGAPIVYGPDANTNFECIKATDKQRFKIGDIEIEALHTPGHTLESTTYLLYDANGKPHCIFTGDTLFLGDVGRPDLSQKGEDLTMQDLAGMLYNSLRNKIMVLPDDVIVYPAHGAGSACGKHMSKETVGTLGEQKQTNYALRADMTKEEFIEQVTDGLLAPPAYFPLNVQMNREGYEDIDDVLSRGAQSLSATAFEAAMHETNAIVLDVRSPKAFKESHIPGSVFVGLDGSFAPWVGAMLKDTNQELLLVVPQGRAEETVTRLSRVGFDKTLGVLEGGIEAWKAAGKTINQIDSIEAEQLNSIEANQIFDVRKPSEFENGHLADVHYVSLDELQENIAAFQQEGSKYVYCGGGYRSVIAISLLKRNGIENLVDIIKGYAAIKNTDLPIVQGSHSNN